MHQILFTLGQRLKNVKPSGSVGLNATNVVDYLFGGEMRTVTNCLDAPDEPKTESEQRFLKLRCHIDLKTQHLADGVQDGLIETLEKKSPTLGTNAQYQRTSRIKTLPRNMIVQFVRFFWRKDTHSKAKIVKKVTFPDKLDVFPFCDEALQASLNNARNKLREHRDAKMGLSKVDAIKEQSSDSSSMDTTADDTPAASPLLPTDTSGMYELSGVVTHRGRLADSGHYVGWCRQAPGSEKWFKFDDDVVTEVGPEAIVDLNGSSSDWHMSYLCIYRRIDDMKELDAESSAPKKL